MKKIFSFLLCGAMLFGFIACESNEPTNSTSDAQTIPEGSPKEAVDLGLSVKWASCNVGATNPSETGGYFAWGETSTKNDYSWSTYALGNPQNPANEYDYDDSKLIKYNETDKKTILDLVDDAANANWGGEWRMPTKAEFAELRSECIWEWLQIFDTNGKIVRGYLITGNTGNSIFLPAVSCYEGIDLTGVGLYGYYWSSELYSSEKYGIDPLNPYYLYFDLGYLSLSSNGRCYGRSVRPVCQ